MVREAVGVFPDVDSLEAAVDELLRSGFDRAELSVLATDKALGDRLVRDGDVRDLEDDPEAPRSVYVPRQAMGEARGALIAALAGIPALFAAASVGLSGGTLMAAVRTSALAAGTGGVAGTVLGQWLERRHARKLGMQMERGGLLLWVHVRDPDHEARATRILAGHAAADVHVHRLRP